MVVCQLNHVNSYNKLQKTLDKHVKIFNEERWLIEEVQVRLFIDLKAPSEFFRVRRVPDALGTKLNRN